MDEPQPSAVSLAYEQQLPIPREPSLIATRLLRTYRVWLAIGGLVLLVVLLWMRVALALELIALCLLGALHEVTNVLSRHWLTREGIHRRLLGYTIAWPWRDVENLIPDPGGCRIIVQVAGRTLTIPATRAFIGAHASVVRRMWREGIRGSGERRIPARATLRLPPGLVLLLSTGIAGLVALDRPLEWKGTVVATVVLALLAGVAVLVLLSARERVYLTCDGILWRTWARRRRIAWRDVLLVESSRARSGESRLGVFGRRRRLTLTVRSDALPRVARRVWRLGGVLLPPGARRVTFAVPRHAASDPGARAMLVRQAFLSLCGALEWLVLLLAAIGLAQWHIDFRRADREVLALPVAALAALAAVAGWAVFVGVRRAWAARRALRMLSGAAR